MRYTPRFVLGLKEEYIILLDSIFPHPNTPETLTMPMVKKSISVTDRQNNWIKAQIKTGHYGNESEVVRELIRERQIKEQESPTEIEAIRSKLIEAEKSGFTEQSAEEILREIKGNLRRNGEL